jgi:hypothetical protein
MLAAFVHRFATAMMSADARRPRAVGRSGRQYQAGIGPHSEQQAIHLVLDEMSRTGFGSVKPQVAYPYSRQRCDIFWTAGEADWAIEVKMVHFRGDNGKMADTSVQDILSPYEGHHSALSDCRKLVSAGFLARTSVLIYAFDDEELRLDPLVEAFEILAFHAVC